MATQVDVAVLGGFPARYRAEDQHPTCSGVDKLRGGPAGSSEIVSGHDVEAAEPLRTAQPNSSPASDDVDAASAHDSAGDRIEHCGCACRRCAAVGFGSEGTVRFRQTRKRAKRPRQWLTQSSVPFALDAVRERKPTGQRIEE